MCTFYYSGKHCFGNMSMVDFLSQTASSPLRQWRDKDRNTGIQVLLDVGICSEEENVCLVYFPIANHSCLVCIPPASSLLFCMRSHKNLPSTVLFQQDLLHVPETLVWNLPGYWVPAWTCKSAGCPFERVRCRLSKAFPFTLLPSKNCDCNSWPYKAISN